MGDRRLTSNRVIGYVSIASAVTWTCSAMTVNVQHTQKNIRDGIKMTFCDGNVLLNVEEVVSHSQGLSVKQ